MLIVFAGPLFTSYASHLDDREEYIYLGSAEGCLYKLNVLSTGETKWTTIDPTNPISQSMCMLGTVNMTSGGNQEPVKADVVLFSGESADSHVLAVSLCRYLLNDGIDMSFYVDCLRKVPSSPNHETHHFTNIGQSCTLD